MIGGINFIFLCYFRLSHSGRVCAGDYTESRYDLIGNFDYLILKGMCLFQTLLFYTVYYLIVVIVVAKNYYQNRRYMPKKRRSKFIDIADV